MKERAQQLLTELAGPTAVLREDQWLAISALLEGKPALVVQRTGWGKSAVYFIAAKLLREMGKGPTLLVSPLLSLMRNQLMSSSKMGLVSRTINSTNFDDWYSIERELLEGTVDVLAISPERLNSYSFRQGHLQSISRQAGLVVIDEAHCISTWGHDFRPDYMRIQSVISDLTPGTPILATTATATTTVVQDIVSQLGAEPLVLRGTLDRESLHLSVLKVPTHEERLAAVAALVQSATGSGIVYTLTQDSAEQVASYLSSLGIDAHAYHGGVVSQDRESLETRLLNNEIKVLVATTALGMGYDKPDLAFVIHLGAPSSITAYYQMVGRAGRALPQAFAVLLPTPYDTTIWSYFDSVAFPTRDRIESVVTVLEQGPATETELDTQVDIQKTRLASLLKILDVEGKIVKSDGKWRLQDSQWYYDDARYASVLRARQTDQQAMLEYSDSLSCRMGYLRRQLDDLLPEGYQCGRCDNCTTPLVVELSSTLIELAKNELRSQVVELPIRKMWARTTTSASSRIPPAQQLLTGRALARQGDPGWYEEVENALNSDLNDEIINGVVKVLGKWGWPNGRPKWVTYLPQPQAFELATHIGAVGKLPVLDLVHSTGEVSSRNSSFALEQARTFHSLKSDPPAGPGLLVMSYYDSGWTATVVGSLLSAQGGGPIYPFSLLRK